MNRIDYKLNCTYGFLSTEKRLSGQSFERLAE